MNHNRMKINQARRGIQFTIDESPETVIVYRRAMIDDGFGGLVENPNSDEEAYTITCRLSFERKTVGQLNQSPAGFSTNLQKFILVNYQTTIYENDTFESNDNYKQYKIGAVQPLIKFGGVIGYQAPLIEAEHEL